MWTPINDTITGPTQLVSSAIANLAAKEPSWLPDLRRSDRLWVFSDYSGSNASSAYETYSFFLVDIDSAPDSLKSLHEVRRTLLADGRRMSFTDLRDNRRVQALAPFLRAARTLPGIVMTFAVAKQLGSLFENRSSSQDDPNLVAAIDRLPPGTRERLSRILHFLAIPLAGMSRPGQHLYWITDQDEIVSHKKRHLDTITLAASLFSHYLTHNLGHFKLGTTANDDGTRMIEDLASISDLAAGAVQEALTKDLGNTVTPGEMAKLPESLSDKVVYLLGELGRTDGALRHLCVTMNGDSKKILIDTRRFNYIPRE